MAERGGGERRRVRVVAALLVVHLVVVLGCADGGATTAETPPSSTDTTAASTPGGPSVPDDATGPYPVVDVVDGDTIKVEIDGERVTVRVLGIDTPETRDPRKPVQCFGREATERAEALLDGRSVRLTGDPTQDAYDRYDRLLAYVWLEDGGLFEWTMVADGYAHEYTYDLPYRYQSELRDAERSAQERGAGLWAPSTCAGDTDAAA